LVVNFFVGVRTFFNFDYRNYDQSGVGWLDDLIGMCLISDPTKRAEASQLLGYSSDKFYLYILFYLTYLFLVIYFFLFS
jgi:hypothetical protein